MSANPWLAIDVATAPAVRARQLRDAWEEFVAGRPTDDENEGLAVRGPIADSWERSRDAGVDPSGRVLAPSVTDHREASSLWSEHPLAVAAPVIRDCLLPGAEEAGQLVVVSDADGLLLSVEGSVGIRGRAADTMNFTPGTLWSEPGAGTNAVGTALATGHAVQVFAAEHFNEPVQQWTCAAAPVHDPEDGHLLGIIDLTGDFTGVHPLSLAVVAATAQAVEAFLRCRQQERDERLRARYHDRLGLAGRESALVTSSGRVLAAQPARWVAGGSLAVPPGGGEFLLAPGQRAFAEPLGDEAYVVRALDGSQGRRRPVLTLHLLGPEPPWAELDGRRLRLRRRQAELLALLQAAPEGLGADQLCAELYGDDGRPGSVRVEVSRLRKLLGPWIDTERYRLSCEVQSDVARVRALLRSSAVREAAEACTGPLLPGSDAPGIVRARDDLEGWLRQAVMTSGDPEALWAWLQSPCGADDLLGWGRVLAQLAYDDPRRSRAAARTRALREREEAALGPV